VVGPGFAEVLDFIGWGLPPVLPYSDMAAEVVALALDSGPALAQ